MTVTTAIPDLEGSATDVAKTKRVGFHSFGATVSLPLLLITVLGATTPVPSAVELTLQVTAVLGLLVPVTAALNWTFLLVKVAKAEGVTATPVTVGTAGGGVTAGVGAGVAPGVAGTTGAADAP